VGDVPEDPAKLRPEDRVIPETSLPRVVLTALLFIVFAIAGATKLAGLEYHLESFERWGYPIWFMYAVGLTEMTASGLLLGNKTRPLGAALVAVVMVGAMGTHFTNGEPVMALAPMALFMIAAYVIRSQTLTNLADRTSVPKPRVTEKTASWSEATTQA
jgi:uncharacterized membrane protein YphA (DoxX/SURF4 family)